MDDETPSRNAAGRWEPGVSGNPAGRPRGARNRNAALVHALFEGEAEDVARTVIEQARRGHGVAMRLFLDRVAPAPRGRPVEVELPETGTTPYEAIDGAMRATVRAMSRGEVTPDEARTMAMVIDTRRRSLATVDFERRLTALEEHDRAMTEAKKREAAERRRLGSAAWPPRP